MAIYWEILAKAQGARSSTRSALDAPQSVIAHLRSLRRYLSANEGARVISCHPETFYRLIASGLPAEKRGRRWRIDPIKFADWLEAEGFASAAKSVPSARSQKGGTTNQ